MQKLTEAMQREVNGGGVVRHVCRWQGYAGQKYYIVNPTGWMYLMDYDPSRGDYGYYYCGYLEYDE